MVHEWLTTDTCLYDCLQAATVFRGIWLCLYVTKLGCTLLLSSPLSIIFHGDAFNLVLFFMEEIRKWTEDDMSSQSDVFWSIIWHMMAFAELN